MISRLPRQVQPPILGYASPPARRTRRQVVRAVGMDLVDLWAGWRGPLLVMVVFVLMNAPQQRVWIAGALLLLITLLSETIVTLWHRQARR
jgi:hypothetical protein